MARSAEGLAYHRANHDPMKEHEVSRTLVKSPPELWAELSDATSLSRHLDRFGEIRITRLEPETAIAWEGERASGTVRIEPSGWGTRVILKATAGAVAEVAPAVEEPVAGVDPGVAAVLDPPPPAQTDPEPVAEVDPEPVAGATKPPAPAPAAAPAPPRVGFFVRLRGMFTGRGPAAVAEPEAVADPEPHAAREAIDPPAPPVADPPSPPVADPPSPPVADPPSAPVAEAPADSPSQAESPDPRPAPARAVAPAPAVDVALAAALDSLGQAHHRPFSRA